MTAARIVATVASMGEELLTGRVTQFRKEQGFGVITLDDGRDVKFDSSACTMVPEEGDSVRLRIAPAKWGGGFKALHVEPASSKRAPTPLPISLDQQIAMLQGEHLVAGLSEKVMARLVADLFDNRLADATLLGILDGYYDADEGRAIADGYLRCDGKVGEDDMLSELAARVPRAQLPRQTKWESSTLHVALPDGGERSLAVAAFDDIVALANEALAAANDERRFYAIATGGDWRAYLALTPDRAERLTALLQLRTPGAS